MLSLQDVELGVLVCRSWVLLLVRVVETSASGCTLTDRVSFALRRPLARLPGLAASHGRVVRAIFAHRHRRLEARFGAGATPPSPT